jgi:hypothetical protein
MITMQRHVIGALVRHYQLTPGAIGVPFYDLPPDDGYAAQVAQWYESLPPTHQLPREALNLLAAPDLVADVRIFQGRDSLIRTWVMTGFGAKAGLALLTAPQGENGALKITVQESPEVFADTVLTWLIAGSEPSEPELNVRLTHEELTLLLTLTDLYSRDAYSSYIAHRPVEEQYPNDLIARAYHEAVTVDDPRWLLSFALPLLDDRVGHLEEPSLAQALQGLARRGLIEPAGQNWKFTLPGQYVALSFHRRRVTVGIDTIAADADGRLGTHAAILLRSDEPLWFLSIPPGEEAVLTGVSVVAARQILDGLLTPQAPAPPYRAAAAQPQTVTPSPAGYAPPPPPPAPGPPSYAAGPAPHSAQPPYATPGPSRFCPSCGQPAVQGAVFCGNCGARVG